MVVTCAQARHTARPGELTDHRPGGMLYLHEKHGVLVVREQLCAGIGAILMLVDDKLGLAFQRGNTELLGLG